MALAEKTCAPCNSGSPPLPSTQVDLLLAELDGWQVVDKKLVKTVKVANFADSLALANEIGAVAEQQNHHPDLLVRWGALRIELWTHAIDSLTENDFILAAKIDKIVRAG